MIHSTPKPLPQHRLRRLLNGLSERMNGDVQQTAIKLEELGEEMTSRRDVLEQEVQAAKLAHGQQAEQTTHDWDTAAHSVWDSAELRTYKALFETRGKELRLKQQSQSQIDATNAEAQQRVEEIEKRFMKNKEVPLRRLRNIRASSLNLKEQLDAHRESAESSLRQRSLAIPAVEPPVYEAASPSDANGAHSQLQNAVQQAQQQCLRITDNRLATFFESAGFWGVCAIVLIGTTAALSLLQVLDILPSILVGAGTTVTLVLASFLGIRPWLKKSVANEYPKLKSLLNFGEARFELTNALAVEENDQELKRLAAKRDERFEQAQEWRTNQINEINAKYEEALIALRKQAAAERRNASAFLTQGLDETNSNFESRVASESTQHQQQIQLLSEACEADCTRLQQRIEELDRGSTQRMRVASQKAIQFVARSQQWSDLHFPDWDNFEDKEHWPTPLEHPILPIGQLQFRDAIPPGTDLNLDDEQASAPILFSPLRDQYLVIHGDPASILTRDLVRNLIMRALTALPAGKTQVCVIDPPGLGRDFGWLMHLSDFDPQLVSHRVWTQPSHIAQQLNSLARAAEDFIQQSLRNEYSDIVAYNADAGALAEPFRLLVWSSMPSGMDDQSWKSLQSVLDSGARCGIIPILVVDEKESWPYPEQQELVNRRGLHLKVDAPANRLVLASPDGNELQLKTSPAPNDAMSQQIIREVGRRALLSSRVEVPLERMIPPENERWQGDSSHSLDIPIGQSGVGRTHCLTLGVGTAQHAIIAGKTGSGKSSLLHALITSAALKYAPEQLRLVLLDFKKGVEFQVYSDAEIPHADIIGIESHREFGLSALEYIDGCMQRRGEAFRAAGVQDIASWNAVHPEQPWPRMLVVVDEFQELFVEDDKLSGQASLILDRIVRQGRSFGVHAVLSSQTLAGSYSLPRTTLGQMAVRIALQCDASDAQIIFAEDNPAAARLKHPGQAVYNNAGGRIEGNQPMQIGWLPKETQVQLLEEHPQGYRNADPSTNLLGRTVVYDGNRAATWTNENANLAIESAQQEVNPDAIWCVAGESVAIEPAVVFPLTRQSGRNMLIVGGDDPQAAAVLDTATASFVKSGSGAQIASGDQLPKVFVIQGGKPTDAKALALSKRWESLECDLRSVDLKATNEIIQEVYEILQSRAAEEDADGPTVPVLLNLIQIGRLRSLRKEDDFASFGESEMTPDKQLEEILRDGPSVGIHTMIWAESYSTVARWLSRASLREIEIRMLMQMSGNDSTNLVDSIAASRLGDNVMLLFDEATGQELRFRPFANDSLNHLADWSNG